MRTVVLTFDNLGEAAEQERGTWSREDGPHPSVEVALPWLLDTLAALDLRATFFVEGVNAQRHPEALRAIAGHGHELGLHAWAHDRWGSVAEDEQARLLARGVEAFAALGLTTRAFRPPGGALTEGSLRRLADAGIAWCSPDLAELPGLATTAPTTDPATRVVLLPFRWPLVDALYLHPPLAQRRRAAGLGEAPLGAAQAVARLEAELARDDPATLVLHPFLMSSEPGRETYGGLLARLAERRNGGEIAVVAGDEAARASGGPALYG